MLTEVTQFLGAVHERCIAIVTDPGLDAAQRELLRAYLVGARAAKIGAVADPAAVLCLIARAEHVEDRAELRLLAAGCTLYYLALRLFDDIADDELDPPWDRVPTAILSHAALTLFTLAFDAIYAGAPTVAHESVRRALREHSLRASAAQHRDLTSAVPAGETAVLAHNADKSSVFALIVELGAIYCGCAPARVDGYRRVGDAISTMRQATNDIRGIFSGSCSGDLARRRNTLPIACFRARATAEQLDELAGLHARLPETLQAIRALLRRSPAIQACLAVIERARQQVHRELLTLVGPGSPLDLYRAFVDATAADFYRAEPVEPPPVFQLV